MSNDALENSIRIPCTMYTPSEVVDNELRSGWWPEDCLRTGEVTDRYLPEGWDYKGEYLLCPSCLARYEAKWPVEPSLIEIMEGV